MPFSILPSRQTGITSDKEKSIRKLSKTLSDLTLDKASKHNVLLLPPPKLSFTPQSAKTPDSGFNTMDYALPLKNPEACASLLQKHNARMVL